MKLELDEHGFLKQREQWNPQIAQQLAEQEGVTLTEDHWVVIRVLQDFYSAYLHFPGLRALTHQLAQHWDKSKCTGSYLHQLFPEAPLKKASKIAGLPKPPRCL